MFVGPFTTGVSDNAVVSPFSLLFSLPSPFMPTVLQRSAEGSHTISLDLSDTAGVRGVWLSPKGRGDVGKCPVRRVLKYMPDLLSLYCENLILILSLIDQISCISILAVAVSKMKWNKQHVFPQIQITLFILTTSQQTRDG